MRRSLRHLSNRVRQGQQTAQEIDENIPVVDVELTCPACKGRMRLRRNHHGLFWGCDTYVACGTTHGAHEDGTPLGLPADKETKAWRVRAHNAFDPLWQSGKLSRTDAYQWLCYVLNKTSDEGHIGRFTIDECKLLIDKIEERERSALRR